MTTLEIQCPVCAEWLEMDEQQRAEVEVGDVIVCESCNAEMEVTANQGDDFELELLGVLTTCPGCGEEFEVTEDLLSHAPVIESSDGVSVTLVDCPHCHARIELEMRDDNADPDVV